VGGYICGTEERLERMCHGRWGRSSSSRWGK
jgi:hypothetical protein